MNKNCTYDIEHLRQAVKDCICISDVCRILGVTVSSFNYKRIKRLCTEHNISTEHFDIGIAFRRGKKNLGYKDIFCINSKVNRTQIRRHAIKHGLDSDKCSRCGISEWNNLPITLQLDHVNGDTTDNREENLRWLCPNCHSQTPTHRSKNIKYKRLLKESIPQ